MWDGACKRMNIVADSNCANYMDGESPRSWNTEHRRCIIVVGCVALSLSNPAHGSRHELHGSGMIRLTEDLRPACSGVNYCFYPIHTKPLAIRIGPPPGSANTLGLSLRVNGAHSRFDLQSFVFQQDTSLRHQ